LAASLAAAGTVRAQALEFEHVEDFAFTKDGRLLVTDAGHARVQAFGA
jgi:hypothetical protein